MDSTSFTFLATVLVLVLLSASLVLRSFILRRRYRQRFQQALADGLLVDLGRSPFDDPGRFDPLGGVRRTDRRLGPKPVLWDIQTCSVGKSDMWSSIMPVAAWRTSSLSPSQSISSSQPSTGPDSPHPPQTQPPPSLFSRLHLLTRFSSPRQALSRPPGQPQTPAVLPTTVGTRSAPAQPGSSELCTRIEKEAATLEVCVLVAMPDGSMPIHRPVPDAKGKGIDLLGSQAHRQHDNVDSVLLSPLQQSGQRICDSSLDVNGRGLPCLEFGVVEVKAGE